MKNIKTRSTFVCKVLPIFSIIILLSSINYQVSVLAQEDDKSDDNEDLLKMNVRMNLNNLELKDNDKIKIVAYVNGETGIRYLDPHKENNQITGNFLTVDMKFNKTNEIAWVGEDEYFVCGYVLNDEEPIQPNNYSKIKPYDCDEAQTIEGADQTTTRLFSTMKKFQKSVDLNTFSTKSKEASDEALTTAFLLNTKGNQDSDEVKITVITPIYDQTDVEFLTVIAMVKGEYQIKTVNIEETLKKAGGNTDEDGEYADEDYIIKVPFVFKRSTEIGTIEVGDMIFGCASSEKLGPPQNTECEKKFIKNFVKSNNIVTRHEEDLAQGGRFS